MTTANDILGLFARKGGLAYEGEGISQIAHAWQCGQLSRQAGATPSLQLASWLHDMGHLLTDHLGTPTLEGLNDRHEESAAELIAPIWGNAVAEPVRLHVNAKRYLVSTHAQYLTALSEDSKRSLILQGGIFSDEECARFQTNPFAIDAQRLRSWDDLAKREGWFAQSSSAALGELEALMRLVKTV
jgi:predicted HD phosphohydrolase